MPHLACQPRRASRPGSTYVIVLGVAMIVSICTFAGMQVARLQLRTTKANNDLEVAKLQALAGVEHAIAAIRANSNWRTTYTSEATGFQFQDGVKSFAWQLIDEDGSLSNDPTDAVTIVGTGRCGEAVWLQRAWARPDRGLPLEALNTAVHSSGELSVPTAKTLSASGAPVSTDRNLALEGTIAGDAHAASRTGGGNITGASVIPMEPKGVPYPSAFNDYMARATPLAYVGNMERVVLAPDVNEYGGGLNADGVYSIDTAGSDLVIRNTRLYGTLVINAGTRSVTIDQSCSMRPYRDDFPVLVIKGYAVYLGLDSTGANEFLDEAQLGHNFNPPGAPYQNAADAGQTGRYPSEIRGLVHVMGTTYLTASGVYRGALLVQGKLTLTSGSPQFIHDRNLILNPPLGYSSNPNGTDMILQSRSWTRQAPP